MSIDHMLDGADPKTAAEAALVLAEATVDDSGATDQERADAWELIDLGVEELTARFTPEAADDRSPTSPGAVVPSVLVLVNSDVASASALRSHPVAGSGSGFYRAAERAMATDMFPGLLPYWPKSPELSLPEPGEGSGRGAHRAPDDADSVVGRDRD